MSMLLKNNAALNAQIVKEEALKLGFSFCGISKADFLESEAPHLEQWLKSNMHGEMQYMENHFDKRLDPRKLVEGTQSVVSLLYNYFPQQEIPSKDNFKVSKYAYATDYHSVVKDHLKTLMNVLQRKIGQISGRVFVDSAPILERAWAQKSGLGWMGKNGMIIHPKAGSFFFLAEMLLDIPLAPDGPIKDYCGTCTRCIDACPTEAIVAPKIVDGSKCISYFTIELKNEIPNEVKGQFDDWIFGCDVCQDVCPWNRFSKPHNEPLFEPSEDFFSMKKKDWIELTEEVFQKTFKSSPLKRTKLKGIQRNVKFVNTLPTSDTSSLPE